MCRRVICGVTTCRREPSGSIASAKGVGRPCRRLDRMLGGPAAPVTAAAGIRPGSESQPCPYGTTNTHRYRSCALAVLARRAYVSAVAAHSRPQIRNNGDHKTRSHRVVRVATPVAS